MVPSAVLLVIIAASCTALSEGENPTHYGNPDNQCREDEKELVMPGFLGKFCSPECNEKNECPKDKPEDTTADPICAFTLTSSQVSYCTLVCDPKAAESQCGNAECETGSADSYCTYASTDLTARRALRAEPVV